MLIGFREVYGFAGPGFEDDMMKTPPAPIVEPQPQAGTLVERELQKKTLTR
jgi:hypothetical protein